jgi:hypothetical protein
MQTYERKFNSPMEHSQLDSTAAHREQPGYHEVMSRRLITLVVALAIAGGPLGHELCRLSCATSSAASAHAHHRSGQPDSGDRRGEPRIAHDGVSQQHQAANHHHISPPRAPLCSDLLLADEATGVTPASHLCGTADASVTSLVPPGPLTLDHQDQAPAAKGLSLDPIPISAGVADRDSDVRSPIPLPLLTPLRV